MRLLFLAATLALPGSFAHAAPPPPPPEFISVAAKTLTAQLTPGTLKPYADLFGDDTRVFLDGSEIAVSKPAWLALQKEHLERDDRRLVGYSEGADNVLVVVQYDDRSRLPTAPDLAFDPRYVTRVERYQFGADHLIHQVRIIQGGGMPWKSGV